MRLIHVSAALLVASVALASDPAKGPRLPSAPVVPPAPMPDPQHPVTLADGVEYVVDFEAPCIVRSFPKSRVSVETIQLKAGETLLLPGHFIDGAGKRETRRFAGPLYVYRVSAAEDGACELMVLPVGGTEADLIVRPLLVKTGQGPQPPPTPPGPGPQPKPPEPRPDAPIPAPGLRVLVVYDTAATLPAKQQSILTGKDVRDWLETNCVANGATREYRIWDAKTNGYLDSKLWGDAMTRKRDKLPWVVVSNGRTGFEGPLPESPEAFLELAGKYKP